LDQIKTSLGASDEDFTALQPKIEQVMTLQRQANAGMGGRGGQGGPGGPGGGPGGPGGGPGGPGGGPGGPGGGNQPTGTPSAVQAAVQALRETLNNNDAKPDEIKAKLDALRAARAQARQNLTKAQEDLRSVLTQRQEAVLVTMGLLE
jgi:hypothetical protein